MDMKLDFFGELSVTASGEGGRNRLSWKESKTVHTLFNLAGVAAFLAKQQGIEMDKKAYFRVANQLWALLLWGHGEVQRCAFPIQIPHSLGNPRRKLEGIVRDVPFLFHVNHDYLSIPSRNLSPLGVSAVLGACLAGFIDHTPYSHQWVTKLDDWIKDSLPEYFASALQSLRALDFSEELDQETGALRFLAKPAYEQFLEL